MTTFNGRVLTCDEVSNSSSLNTVVDLIILTQWDLIERFNFGFVFSPQRKELLSWEPHCPFQQNFDRKLEENDEYCEATNACNVCRLSWTYTMRRHMQEVAPGVFLGPLSAAKVSNLKTLENSNVTHIVCVRGPCEAALVRPKFPDRFKYLVLEIADKPTENIIPYFRRVRDFINESLSQGGKTLVHGTGGISRSAALVIAYIMEKYGLSYKEAFHHLQKQRFCVNPNYGFAAQLVEFEPIYQAKIAIEASPENCESVERGSKRRLDDLESESMDTS